MIAVGDVDRRLDRAAPALAFTGPDRGSVWLVSTWSPGDPLLLWPGLGRIPSPACPARFAPWRTGGAGVHHWTRLSSQANCSSPMDQRYGKAIKRYEAMMRSLWIAFEYVWTSAGLSPITASGRPSRGRWRGLARAARSPAGSHRGRGGNSRGCPAFQPRLRVPTQRKPALQSAVRWLERPSGEQQMDDSARRSAVAPMPVASKPAPDCRPDGRVHPGSPPIRAASGPARS